MDIETLLLVVAGVVGTIAAGAHMLGYVPPRYKRVLSAIQASTASGIGKEVERALNAALDRQRALAQADMEAAMKAQAEAADGATKSAEMSIVRAIGVDKQSQAKVGRLLGEAILGPAMPILRQFAPGLADALEENPQLIDVVVQNPLFKKYVAPRIEQYLGSMGGTNTEPASGGGWGT